MKTKRIFLAMAFCMASAIACLASDPNLGTWKLNEAKSKIPAGVTKNMTVAYSAESGQYKCVIDGVSGDGNPVHSEWTGKFDGKDYPVTGDSTVDARSVQKVNDRHYKVTNKKDGKATLTGTIELSADGKSRTLVVHPNDKSGKKMTAEFFYDKQ